MKHHLKTCSAKREGFDQHYGRKQLATSDSHLVIVPVLVPSSNVGRLLLALQQVIFNISVYPQHETLDPDCKVSLKIVETTVGRAAVASVDGRFQKRFTWTVYQGPTESRPEAYRCNKSVNSRLFGSGLVPLRCTRIWEVSVNFRGFGAKQVLFMGCNACCSWGIIETGSVTTRHLAYWLNKITP